MLSNKRLRAIVLGTTLTIAFVVVGIGVVRSENASQADQTAPKGMAEGNVVTVSDTQAKTLKVETAGLREFADEREAVGFIDFNQDQAVQVFSPWSGRIAQVQVKAGDDVRRGALLYTIDSPDLVQAESSLISTAGLVQLATKALERAQQLAEIKGNAQKDLEQAVSDQQTAEGNYQAARKAVRIFGKSEADIDQIVATRKTDGLLPITSPLAGRVTARTAAPGMLVQPGNGPAPLVVADISDKWMVANVPEYILPRLRLGAPVAVSLQAFPGRQFEGKITNIGAAIDANTHTVAVRSEVKDPHHELLPQMLATFTIRTGEVAKSVSVPQATVVREGDGTVTVFVTQDGRRFERRVVKLGIQHDGLQQILEGITPGEKIATEGALFLSNALALSVR